MRKQTLAALTFGLVLLLASCSGASTDATSNQTEAPAPILADQLDNELVPAQTPSYSEADVQRITVAEAKDLVDQGSAILYDVRSPQSFGELHAAGAVSFHDDQAASRLGELPADQQLIFY